MKDRIAEELSAWPGDMTFSMKFEFLYLNCLTYKIGDQAFKVFSHILFGFIRIRKGI